MTKIGRIVTDPSVGSYCRLTIPSGERLMVSHEKSGRLSVHVVKMWGLSSEPVFEAALDSPQGQALVTRLTGGQPPSGGALEALVDQLKDCESMAAVRARCAALGRSS
jgi:hypothetical protein